MSQKGRNNILLLGPENVRVLEYLRSFGDSVNRTEEHIHLDDDIVTDADLILSYGYRYIITSDVVARFDSRLINLHISLLPYNRGADPNLWSYLEDSPKGVSIHYVDSGIDTGDIIAQREVACAEGDTLRSSYDRLKTEIEKLLFEVWPDIRIGKVNRSLQEGQGTFHRLKDRKQYEHLLTLGWDTPVRSLIGRALAKMAGDVD